MSVVAGFYRTCVCWTAIQVALGPVEIDASTAAAAVCAAFRARDAGWLTIGPDEPSAGGPDGNLATVDAHLTNAAHAALEGEVGNLARSHGGAIELESVRDGVVTVRMGGACHGCQPPG